MSLVLFDKGAVVVREHMLHVTAAEVWVPLGALAKPRAKIPKPANASASLAFFAGGELRATLSSFEARLNAVGGLELTHVLHGAVDPVVRLTIHGRIRDAERYEAFVHGKICDAFIHKLLTSDLNRV